jgi:hypothetical protein
VADATAQQEQAKREGNGMAVALHGKEIADALKRIEVLQAQPPPAPAETTTTRAEAMPAAAPLADIELSPEQAQRVRDLKLFESKRPLWPEERAELNRLSPQDAAQRRLQEFNLIETKRPLRPEEQAERKALTGLPANESGSLDQPDSQIETDGFPDDGTLSAEGPWPELGSPEHLALPPEARDVVGQLARNQQILTTGQWGDGRRITAAERVGLQVAQRMLQLTLQEALPKEGAPDYITQSETYESSSPTAAQENAGRNQGTPGTTQGQLAPDSPRVQGIPGRLGGPDGSAPWWETPQTWSSQEAERRFFEVKRRLREEFERVPLDVVAGDSQSGPPMRVTGWGQTLRYSPKVIAGMMNDIRALGYNEHEWLESLVGEELIHSRQLILSHENLGYYNELYKVIPERVKQQLPTIYTKLRDASGNIIPHKAAIEYERIVIQYRQTGTTTEEAMGRDIDLLKPFLEGMHVPAIENNIAQVESLISERPASGRMPGRTGEQTNRSFEDDASGIESSEMHPWSKPPDKGQSLKVLQAAPPAPAPVTSSPPDVPGARAPLSHEPNQNPTQEPPSAERSLAAPEESQSRVSLPQESAPAARGVTSPVTREVTAPVTREVTSPVATREVPIPGLDPEPISNAAASPHAPIIATPAAGAPSEARAETTPNTRAEAMPAAPSSSSSSSSLPGGEAPGASSGGSNAPVADQPPSIPGLADAELSPVPQSDWGGWGEVTNEHAGLPVETRDGRHGKLVGTTKTNAVIKPDRGRAISVPKEEARLSDEPPAPAGHGPWTAADMGDPSAPSTGTPPEPNDSPVPPRRSPVSRAVTIVGNKTGENGDWKIFVNQGLTQIDRVHDDGVLPEIHIACSNESERVGNTQLYRDPDGTLKAYVTVSRNGPWQALTTCHEIGHLLDCCVFGTGGRSSFATHPIWYSVREAINHSKAVAEIQKLTPSSEYAYYLKPEELWARAYAQYIAEKSGDITLLGDLPRVRAARPWCQWETSDFAPIRSAIDATFRKKGWL